MFTSAKDIMKIIWNGLKEIKKNCSEYCEKDARKIYEETLERVKDELSGPEPEEIRKERLVRNRWEKDACRPKDRGGQYIDNSGFPGTCDII